MGHRLSERQGFGVNYFGYDMGKWWAFCNNNSSFSHTFLWLPYFLYAFVFWGDGGGNTLAFFLSSPPPPLPDGEEGRLATVCQLAYHGPWNTMAKSFPCSWSRFHHQLPAFPAQLRFGQCLPRR